MHHRREAPSPAPVPAWGPAHAETGLGSAHYSRGRAGLVSCCRTAVCFWHRLPGVCKAFRRWGCNLPPDHPPCRPHLQDPRLPALLTSCLQLPGPLPLPQVRQFTRGNCRPQDNTRLKWLQFNYKAGVPSLQDLMPDHLKCSWCNNTRNKVYNKCNALEVSWNHPSPPWSMGNLSSIRQVPRAKKFGDLCKA